MRIIGFGMALVFASFFFGSCDSFVENSDEAIFLKEGIIKGIEVDSTKIEKYYVQEIKGDELVLGPEVSQLPTDDLKLRVLNKIVQKYDEATMDWIDYDQIKFVRDRGFSRYQLIDGHEYLIKNGELRVLFDEKYLTYDYNLLTCDEENWKFSPVDVSVKFKRGNYSKGEQFVRFATIEDIKSDEKDLDIFVNTDIEIDDDLKADDWYNGQLIYIRDEEKSFSWSRNNFKFLLSESSQ